MLLCFLNLCKVTKIASKQLSSPTNTGPELAAPCFLSVTYLPHCVSNVTTSSGFKQIISLFKAVKRFVLFQLHWFVVLNSWRYVTMKGKFLPYVVTACSMQKNRAFLVHGESTLIVNFIAVSMHFQHLRNWKPSASTMLGKSSVLASVLHLLRILSILFCGLFGLFILFCFCSLCPPSQSKVMLICLLTDYKISQKCVKYLCRVFIH